MRLPARAFRYHQERPVQDVKYCPAGYKLALRGTTGLEEDDILAVSHSLLHGPREVQPVAILEAFHADREGSQGIMQGEKGSFPFE